ncbi:MAG TPA: hypothetical protein VF550_00550, partial [Polyangia bacterium]
MFDSPQPVSAPNKERKELFTLGMGDALTSTQEDKAEDVEVDRSLLDRGARDEDNRPLFEPRVVQMWETIGSY